MSCHGVSALLCLAGGGSILNCGKGPQSKSSKVSPRASSLNSPSCRAELLAEGLIFKLYSIDPLHSGYNFFKSLMFCADYLLLIQHIRLLYQARYFVKIVLTSENIMSSATVPQRRPQLIVALDLPSTDGLPALLRRLPAAITYFKVGLELFIADGPAALTALRAAHKKVFLDLKLNDIPNTVSRAVHAASRHEVAMLTPAH